jgi:dTDP-4-amino-4,6-dideoxygalactose transaminase
VPVFVDIHPQTLNLDPARIEEAITPRTRAIMPVHFAGQAADMDAIMAIAERHGLKVLEDAAHAHGATWRGRKCGSLSDAGSFSFQASKNMTAGEGGCITLNDEALAELCRSYLWAGREPGRPWYEHYRLGWNYRLTEFQAAILRVQLRRLEEQVQRRDENGRYLARMLQIHTKGIAPLGIDDRVTRHSFHLFIFRYEPQAFRGMTRAEFITALNAEGIPCMGGYTHPLYRNPMFLNKDFWKGGFPCVKPFAEDVDFASYTQRCPVSEAACRETVWLTQNMLLGEREDMDDVVEAIVKIQKACR